MDETTLNDLLECSVCLERLDTTSKVLPCQHTFCRKCLQVIVSSHSELRCPECRILVDTKIENLPPNVLLMRILEGIKNTTNIANHNINDRHSNNSVATSIQPEQHANGYNECEPKDVDSSSKDQTKRTTVTNKENVHRAVIEQSADEVHSNESQLADFRLHFVAQNQQPSAISKPNLSVTPHARALYDFESTEPGDLNMRTGDKVFLRRRIDVNWFEGECNGREGVFPINYVRIIVPLPQPHAKALYDFHMDSNEDEGCLTFKKGIIINVHRRVDQNWAEGRIDDKIGIFPISFVEMNSLAKQLMDNSAKYMNSMGHRNVPLTPTERQPHGNPPSDLNTLETSPALTNRKNANKRSNCSIFSTISNGATKNEQLLEQNVTLSPIPSLANDKQPSPRSIGSILRTSEIGCGKPDRNSTAKDIQNNTKEKILAQKQSKSQIIVNKSGDSKPSPQPFKWGATSALNAFIALYPYQPQKPDELELKKGSIYYVKGRCQDGWFRGTNLSQKSGVFPGNYVAPLRNMNDQTVANIGVDIATKDSLSCNSTAIKTCYGNLPELPPRSTSSPSTSTSSAFVWSKPIGQHVEAIFGRSQSSSTVNLIKRITNIKTNHKQQQILPSFSMDNPVFEDNTIACFETTNVSSKSPASKQNTTIYMSQPLHIRSGSCPSQLLQSLSSDPGSSASTHGQRVEMLGPHRIRPNKEGLIEANVNQAKNSGSSSSQSPSTHHRKSQSFDATSTVSGQPSHNGSISSRRKFYTHNEKFKCVVSYPKNSDFELELALGDIVYVHKKRDNGWFKGTHAQNGKVGLFPSSFVEPLI